MTKFLITNCVGTFVLDNKGIIDKCIFQQPAEFENKNVIAHYELQLQKKYPDAKKREEYVFPQCREYLQHLHTAALAYTKVACRAAVQKEHFVMQAVAAIEDLEHATNLLAKRLRQWYALYCPELEHEIADHHLFLDELLQKEKTQILKELKRKTSMGADLSKADFEQIEKLARELQSFYKEKEELEAYIEKIMNDLCPNLTILLGAKLAAELLSHARSLQRLAFLPASTIQLLGAEQALFRCLKKQGRCPKHGVLFKHPFFVQAKKDMHGKLARLLAAAASKAAKLDYFQGEQYQGYALREHVEKQLKRLEKHSEPTVRNALQTSSKSEIQTK